jgi:hypothetical protein
MPESNSESGIDTFVAAGCRVLIFTGFDPRIFPVIRLLRGRIAAYDKRPDLLPL